MISILTTTNTAIPVITLLLCSNVIYSAEFDKTQPNDQSRNPPLTQTEDDINAIRKQRIEKLETLAALQCEAKDFVKAAMTYERLIEEYKILGLVPNTKLYQRLAYLYDFNLGNFDKASIVSCELIRLIKASGQMPTFYDCMEAVHFCKKAEKYTQAIEILVSQIELAKQTKHDSLPNLFQLLAGIYFSLNDHASVMKYNIERIEAIVSSNKLPTAEDYEDAAESCVIGRNFAKAVEFYKGQLLAMLMARTKPSEECYQALHYAESMLAGDIGGAKP